MPEIVRPSISMRSRRTEFTARSDSDVRVVEGYFVVFNQPYFIDDYFEEVIYRTAFDDETDTSDVRALVDHMPHLVLARANESVRTLTFSIDDIGIYCSVEINSADTDAVNLHARVQRGDVDQASFGFEEDDVRYVDLPGGRTRREIHHVSKLWEFSVCTFPAYEQTYVSARSKQTAELAAHELEAKKQKLRRKFKHHA